MKKENTHLPARTGWLSWIPTCTTDFTDCRGGAAVTRASLPLPHPSLLTLTARCKLHGLITHINISDRPIFFPYAALLRLQHPGRLAVLIAPTEKAQNCGLFTLPSIDVPLWGCLLLSCCPHSCPGPASLTMTWTYPHQPASVFSIGQMCSPCQ